MKERLPTIPGPDADAPPHAARRWWHPSAVRGWPWRRIGIVAAVLALVGSITFAVEIGRHASSRPTVSKPDVNSIVDKKISGAVAGLRAAPAEGVGVYAT